MGVPHGFKADADRIAIGLRRQMRLPAHVPMDVGTLAARLGFLVVPLSSFADHCPGAVEQLVNLDVSAFSASLLRIGSARAILVNDGHSLGRRNSNVAHEIAHALLGHPPQPFDHLNGREFNQGVEAEANLLAGHILITNAAALYIVRSGREADACGRYGVSKELPQWRLGTSGARIIQKRWQQRAQRQALKADRRAPSARSVGQD